jgi:hypothetical protein
MQAPQQARGEMGDRAIEAVAQPDPGKKQGKPRQAAFRWFGVFGAPPLVERCHRGLVAGGRCATTALPLLLLHRFQPPAGIAATGRGIGLGLRHGRCAWPHRIARLPLWPGASGPLAQLDQRPGSTSIAAAA